MAGSAPSSTIEVSADTLTHTLTDDDLVDGALYRVELRAAGESWDDASSLYVLGPVIQFSSDTPFMQYTGLPISWELPRASQAKGDMVRYSIVPALPEGLKYGQEAGEDYVDLAASENPSITGAVGHTVGGSKQFYRLMGCDVENGMVDDESCDTHIFEIEITPATVKPLADVIRDREYAIGVALVTSALNQFPQVGVDGADDNYEYSLLDQEDYTALDVPGLDFDDQSLRLSGTPEGPVDEIKVTYRAQRPGSDVWHEAQFTIHIVAIESHVCRTGLNYEETLRVYNKTETVGAANFTVRADSDSYYVLPIGEEGQQGTGATSTRTFQLVTVERGGDLAGPDANMLPAGLQVVKLMVDKDSRNPLTNEDSDKWLYTRQGPYKSSDVMEQMLDADSRYADPEPDYPDTDSGMRLAVGVSDKDMLEVGEYLSCFIVHDTDDDTGETDSSAVVFNLKVLPNLSARDWVIELEGAGDMSELDVDEAFTTDPSLLDFDVMYVEDNATMNDSGCIADEADEPLDIVTWSTANDTVTFTAREVSETMTQRVQVKAELMTGGAEACVQIRITVLPEPPATEQPAGLTAPTMVEVTVSGNDVTITWENAENALSHMVLLFETSDYDLIAPVATMQDDGTTTYSDLAAGTYIVVVVAYDADVNIELGISNTATVPGS